MYISHRLSRKIVRRRGFPVLARRRLLHPLLFKQSLERQKLLHHALVLGALGLDLGTLGLKLLRLLTLVKAEEPDDVESV